MTMTQDTFDKITEALLLLYCMVMFLLSWLYNRPLDIQSFLVLVAPILTHTIHVISAKTPNKTGVTTTV